MEASQVEIYDQIWFVRHMPDKGEHSNEAKELIRDIIVRLKEIPDGCAECFPFDTIDELGQEVFSRLHFEFKKVGYLLMQVNQQTLINFQFRRR